MEKAEKEKAGRSKERREKGLGDLRMSSSAAFVIYRSCMLGGIT